MNKVLINTNFIDANTGELHVAGTYAAFTEERITEIKAVDPNFITIVGNAEGEIPSATPTVETIKPKALEEMDYKELQVIGNGLGLKTVGVKKDDLLAAIEEANAKLETNDETEGQKPSADDLIDDLDKDEDLDNL